jgi:hypothetical protein
MIKITANQLVFLVIFLSYMLFVVLFMCKCDAVELCLSGHANGIGEHLMIVQNATNFTMLNNSTAWNFIIHGV